MTSEWTPAISSLNAMKKAALGFLLLAVCLLIASVVVFGPVTANSASGVVHPLSWT
jgi:hypothetical protein